VLRRRRLLSDAVSFHKFKALFTEMNDLRRQSAE
jgi:hypothetical protein